MEEEFSLNNINIELYRPHKNPMFTKLKYLIEMMKNPEIKYKLFCFFYNIFIDIISRGNKIIYLNDEVIYMHKDQKVFKYFNPTLNKVSFDEKNIIHIHPHYLFDRNKDQMNRLKYVLWSIGILTLKYIYCVSNDNLLNLHRNYKSFSSLLMSFNVEDSHKEFLEYCFSYEECDFMKFYIIFKTVNENKFYLFDENKFARNVDFSPYMKLEKAEKCLKSKSSSSSNSLNSKEIKENINSPKKDSNKNKIICQDNFEDEKLAYPNFKQCPYCFNYIENTGGSKFIICYSLICKGNKYFCWNCNNKLYINDKEKHFSQYGIYSNYCMNLTPHEN